MKLQDNPYLGNSPLERQLDRLHRDIAGQVNALSEGRMYATYNAQTAAPVSGEHAQGDFVRNSNPTELGSAGGTYVVTGWICTAGGTPGTWEQCVMPTDVWSGGAGSTNLSMARGPSDVTIASDTGTDALIPAADGANAGVMTSAMQVKLAGIATGATANSTDAALRDRTTHTGVQAATTITEDATHRFATDAEKTTWNGKQSPATTLAGYGITDAAPLSHVGTGGTAHSAATTASAGFMSAADKVILDALAVDSGWQAPALLSGWLNFGAPYSNAGYRKVGTRVELRGAIRAGTIADGTVLFALAAGYRPPGNEIFITRGQGGDQRIDVESGGNVVLYTCSSSAFVSLSGIYFMVD